MVFFLREKANLIRYNKKSILKKSKKKKIQLVFDSQMKNKCKELTRPTKKNTKNLFS